jgi:hypothetical protein
MSSEISDAHLYMDTFSCSYRDFSNSLLDLTLVSDKEATWDLAAFLNTTGIALVV